MMNLTQSSFTYSYGFKQQKLFSVEFYRILKIWLLKVKAINYQPVIDKIQ